MSVLPGESLLELAVKQGSDPWTLASVNKLSGTWDTLPGDVLYSPVPGGLGSATGLPSAFLSASILGCYLSYFHLGMKQRLERKYVQFGVRPGI